MIVIPRMRGARSLNTKNLLKFIVFFQYIPRVLRVFPLYKEVTRTSGILTETAWAGAAFNLFLYMLASHVSSPIFFSALNAWYSYSFNEILQIYVYDYLFPDSQYPFDFVYFL